MHRTKDENVENENVENDFNRKMVDFESGILGSKVIHSILSSESSDSGIMSDSDAESVEEEDYCRRLENVMRYDVLVVSTYPNGMFMPRILERFPFKLGV